MRDNHNLACKHSKLINVGLSSPCARVVSCASWHVYGVDEAMNKNERHPVIHSFCQPGEMLLNGHRVFETGKHFDGAHCIGRTRRNYC